LIYVVKSAPTKIFVKNNSRSLKQLLKLSTA